MRSRDVQCSLAGVICLLLGSTVIAQMPRNVILYIGDGMCFEHVKAAGICPTAKPGR